MFAPLPVAIASFLSLSTAAAPSVPALAPDTTVPPQVAVEDPPIFPLATVRPGQRGRGFTVFESAKGPEAFDVVVLGVMRNYLGPGEDLIIARLEGERIERTGVISGMSGSPVYIDGKLVGAVGYRFGSFTKDPIAGITPIERMLTAADEAVVTTSRSPGRPVGMQHGPMTAWGQGEPIATPLAASGMAAHVLEAFQPMLAERGYGPVSSAGGSSGPSGAGATGKRFFAGGPIAGDLIEGDVMMGAIGTVTWVKGDRFLAFGHPFMGIGATSMPVANAEIITTVASAAGSWKMGQPTVAVGKLSDDRLHAIAGTMGPPPDMVPLRIRIDTQGPRASRDARRELSYRVFQHPADTPLFVAMALANTLANRVSAEKSGGTVDVELLATLTTGDTIPHRFRAADDAMGFELPVAFGVLGILSAAVDQDFAETRLASVDVIVKSRPEVDRARIVSVDAIRPLVSGQTGEIRVRLQPFRGAVKEARIAIRVPAGLPEGNYSLVAAGHAEAARWERDGGFMPLATTFASYLKNLKDGPPPGSLSLYLVAESPGVRLDGRAVHRLPTSIAGIISEGGGWSGGAVDVRAMRIARREGDGVVTGEVNARVRVASPEDASHLGGERTPSAIQQ